MRTNRQISRNSAESLSSTLGLFSLALGAAELLAPQWIARRVGLGRAHEGTVRLCGVRELATGFRLLQKPSAPDAAWARVAGDVIDLSILTKAFGDEDSDRRMLGGASLAVAGLTAVDVLCAMGLSNGLAATQGQGRRIRETIAINRPPEDLYRFWRNFSNLPTVMDYLEHIEVYDDRRSRWISKPVGNTTLEWEAEVIDDEPNRSISWRSMPDSQVATEGRVAFEPLSHGRGTSVTVDMRFDAPGMAGRLLQPFTRLVADIAARRDLRRLKQFMETGEVSTTEGQPAGRRFGETWLDRAAHA